MPGFRAPVAILLLLAAAVASMSMFIVNEREYAIKLQLGKIVRSDYEPGLHFKIPIIEKVNKYDRRILTFDGKPEQILTGEKKNVVVDYFVKWRISSVEDYYRTFGGREFDAVSRMAQIVKSALTAQLGDRTIRDVVSGDRREIMQKVAESTDAKLRQFGIEIVDFRIKQIELPANVAESVYKRMRAERERIAKEHRANGQKEALIIRARADRKRVEILADARRRAAEIRGAGDAIATRIYAEAYGQDRDFFEFYRSIQAYRKSFADRRDILVLEPDTEYFRYFGKSGD